MKRPLELTLSTLFAAASLLALGACRPSSESRAPTTTTPTTPQSSAADSNMAPAHGAALGASGVVSGGQTAPRTDGTGSAAPAGTPK